MQAGEHTVVPTRTQKLLGAHISENFKWKEHVLGSEQSLVRQLTSRLNGLILICNRAPFKTRLQVANGIFISKLCYLVQLWGGVEGYLLNALQIIQNRAARAVTRKSWFTPTRRLLAECGWMSVRQLAVYQTVLSVQKIVTSGKPEHMHLAMSSVHPVRTRQATSGDIRLGENFSSKLGLVRDSFRYRGAELYNSIPASIKQARSIVTMKIRLKEWVISNVPIN